MTNGTKLIITSLYELKYTNKNNIYKSMTLLCETISNQIFNDFDYVIYTDNKTATKFILHEKFNYNNVTIKIHELNSDFFMYKIDPLRVKKLSAEEVYDRIYTVDNYLEVIHNKLTFLLNEAKLAKPNSLLIWLDAGLFSTSCHDIWRDYIKSIIYNNKIFLIKIFEYLEQYGFLFLKGNNIYVSQEIKERINIGTGLVIGGIFGGKRDEIIKLFENQTILKDYVDNYSSLISEQEILSVLINQYQIETIEFDDWTDLQKGILKLIGIYADDKYNKTNASYYKTNHTKI